VTGPRTRHSVAKSPEKNRETVLTWLRLIEARNEPLPERGDECVLTAVALGSAERRQELWLASMRLDYCSVKQASKLTTVQCPRLDTDHSSCASVPQSTGRHHSRPSVMWKYARISRSSRWLGSSAELVLSNHPTGRRDFPLSPPPPLPLLSKL
jgi:hypothetical protein